MQFVIEFQNLEADHGGPKETAQKFNSKQECSDFMEQYDWIYFNGGMEKEYEDC